jgi:hypothetical protein
MANTITTPHITNVLFQDIYKSNAFNKGTMSGTTPLSIRNQTYWLLPRIATRVRMMGPKATWVAQSHELTKNKRGEG